MKVLLVEDDIRQFLGIKKYLEDFEECSVLMNDEKVIDNYEDALAVCLKEHPDYAVIDIEIKGKKNGIELAKKMQHYSIPYIILTAYDTPINLEKLKKYKPASILYKTDINADTRHLRNAIQVIISTLISVANAKEICITMRTVKKPQTEQKKYIESKYAGYNVKIPLAIANIKYLTTTTLDKNSCLLISDYESEDCFLIPVSLKKVFEMLPNDFMKVSSSYVININEIKEFTLKPFIVKLTNGLRLEVTESYRSEVELILNRKYPLQINK